MSTQSDSDAVASIILFFQETTVNDCTGFARITLLILDWVLNLDREVRMFWNRPRSTAAVLYFGMRWTSLLTEGLALISPSVTNPNACKCNVLMMINLALACSQFVPRSFFSAMRTYGLLKNIAVAALVLVLSLVPFGANLSTYATGIGVSFTTCICTLVADILLIAVTWWITPRRGMIPDLSQIQRKSLVDVIYRDGLVYFVVLFILDMASILVSVLPVLDVTLATSSSLHFLENMTSFVQPLTSILIAHFLLDLQEASRRTLKLNSDDPLYSETSTGGGQQSSLNFARVVGSLGAVIDHSASKDTADRVAREEDQYSEI
ncbi:hypothetical protein V8D89_013322 [Ganoderma adspersum]